jgi:hypothetical protein
MHHTQMLPNMITNKPKCYLNHKIKYQKKKKPLIDRTDAIDYSNGFCWMAVRWQSVGSRARDPHSAQKLYFFLLFFCRLGLFVSDVRIILNRVIISHLTVMSSESLC